MKTLWNVAHRCELQSRIAQLGPDLPARWGRMNAPRMVAHLCDAMRMAVGELVVPSKKLPLRYPPLKQLILYALPFPKHAPTAPQLQRAPGAWEREVADLNAVLGRFVARDRAAEWPEHPAFGPLSAHAWGVLAYRHCDHHLRQFGL